MKLALGTAQVGFDYGIANKRGQLITEETRQLLELARRQGIDTLDTAIAYGCSESILGEVGVNGWRIVSKLPAVADDCSDVGGWVLEQVEQSLARLDVSQLHGVLLHRPLQLLEPVGPALYAALEKIKSSGLVRKIGISVYGIEEIAALADRFHFDLIQAPFNILDQRLMTSGWGERLHRQGVEIHTRSAFLQGLLLMSQSQRPVQFNRWASHWQAWGQWLEAQRISPIDACMRYVQSFDWIDRVVVGVDSVTHLQEILKIQPQTLLNLPNFGPLEDERLINPASWSQL